MIKIKYKKLSKELPGLQKKILLKNYTTFKIGGPAEYFFNAKNKKELLLALEAVKNIKMPFFILGGGSNVLFSDKGFKGLVVKISFSDIKMENGKIYAEAGAELSKLANFCSKNSLGGMEWAMGVPGTLGGAVFGNAQAFGDRISEAVESVEVLNLKSLKIKNFSKEECRFSLKNSIFKNPPAGGKDLVILSVVFALKKENEEIIRQKVEKYMQYRKTRHPINFSSAGSVFVNPEKKITSNAVLKKYPELIKFNEAGTIPAGFMIQNSGLSGKKIGKAQISKLHSNFIVNLGGAKAKDVISLLKLAQKKVKKNFGISLEPEAQIISQR